MHVQTLRRANLLKLARDGHVTAELDRRAWLRAEAADEDGRAMMTLLLGQLEAELAAPANMLSLIDDEGTTFKARLEAMHAEVADLLSELDAIDRLLVDPSPQFLKLLLGEVVVQGISLGLTTIFDLGQLAIIEDAVD